MKSSGISFCDTAVSASSGCQGCELWGARVSKCYAGQLQERRLSRSLPDLYDANFENVRLIPGRVAKAAALSDLRGTERPDKPWLNGLPRIIFLGHMSDFCSADIPDDYIEQEMFQVMESEAGRRHFWLALTKRPERLRDLSLARGGLPDNCMAMTTLTSKQGAWARMKALSKTKCRWKGLSLEPLWGKVDVICPVWTNMRLDLHWVIVGGESGKDVARPLSTVRVNYIKEQCDQEGIPFYFKQWGDWMPVDVLSGEEQVRAAKAGVDVKRVENRDYCRVGHLQGFKLLQDKLDGREWKAMPRLLKL